MGTSSYRPLHQPVTSGKSAAADHKQLFTMCYANKPQAPMHYSCMRFYGYMQQQSPALVCGSRKSAAADQKMLFAMSCARKTQSPVYYSYTSLYKYMQQQCPAQAREFRIAHRVTREWL